jgi:hypothetical protein
MSESSRPALNSMQGILEQIWALFRSVNRNLKLIILINNFIRLLLDIDPKWEREDMYWWDEDTKEMQKKWNLTQKVIFR